MEFGLFCYSVVESSLFEVKEWDAMDKTFMGHQGSSSSITLDGYEG